MRTSSRASATRWPWPRWKASTKASHDQLLDIMRRLEEHYQDLCDIEFTIERGKLWMLQTRVGKRTAQAAFRIATNSSTGVITDDEAIQRVNGEQLAQLMFPLRLLGGPHAGRQGHERLARRGRRQGGLRLRHRRGPGPDGREVILVRRETNPDDLHGMIAAQGSSPRAAGRPRTPPSSLAAWARPVSAAPTRSLSTPSAAR